MHNNFKGLRNFILKNDTIIIPEDKNQKVFCSKSVEKKVHKAIVTMKEKFYYIKDDKIFFIFSKKYPWIWEVKILYDTTPYVKTQILIIKFSLLLILISLFLFYFLWKKITKHALKDLNKIAKKVSELDLEKDLKKIEIVWNKDDEINILIWKINDWFCHIKKQTTNLKQFITDISHEFKTPLMVINSQIDLFNKKIEKNKLEKDDTKILLENIKEKTKKLNNLLETFLFLSRVENKIENLNYKEKNLSNYIKNFIQNYLKENNISDISIQFNCQKDINIKLEENTFNILFWNLLSNAIKFLNKKTWKIEIWCDEKSFWIKDNWVWIKKEDLDKIFDKFFRKDKNIEWFWVGLFLVKRLLNVYNWKIKVESEIRKGAKFIVFFK